MSMVLYLKQVIIMPHLVNIFFFPNLQLEKSFGLSFFLASLLLCRFILASQFTNGLLHCRKANTSLFLGLCLGTSLGTTMPSEALTMFFTQVYWDESIRMLGDLRFLDKLLNFDKDSMSEEIQQHVAAFASHSEFNPNRMMTVSKAAAVMCKWLIAIHQYNIAKKVSSFSPLWHATHSLRDVNVNLSLSLSLLSLSHSGTGFLTQSIQYFLNIQRISSFPKGLQTVAWYPPVC
jgi:hypothetical protein